MNTIIWILCFLAGLYSIGVVLCWRTLGSLGKGWLKSIGPSLIWPWTIAAMLGVAR
jgi:hypothetical protein